MSNYHTIKKYSISDGIGVRVALYLSGCNWHCHNCHNPQTWDPASGKPFTQDTIEEIKEALNHEFINGITFTGGDPLHECNLDTVMNVIAMVRQTFDDSKDIWLYTGYTLKDIIKDKDKDTVSNKRYTIVRLIDVLVDGQFVEELKDITYPFAGSRNQKVTNMRTMEPFDRESYYLRKDDELDD